MGGTTMGSHSYKGCDREGMALTLPTMYPQNHTINGQDFLSQHQQPHNLEFPTMAGDSSNGYIGYDDLHSLSLSMTPISSVPTSDRMTNCIVAENKKRVLEKADRKPVVNRKSMDTFGQRTSQYRGVTRLVFSKFIFIYKLDS